MPARQIGWKTVILLVSAAGDEERVRGMEVGVEDFLAYPVNPSELVARVFAPLGLAMSARELLPDLIEKGSRPPKPIRLQQFPHDRQHRCAVDPRQRMPEAPRDGDGDGEVVAEPGYAVAPEARRVGLMFQDFALFPHLTVAENVAVPLILDGRPATDAVR